jgi:hypothetical protein
MIIVETAPLKATPSIEPMQRVISRAIKKNRRKFLPKTRHPDYSELFKPGARYRAFFRNIRQTANAGPNAAEAE